MDFSYGMKSLWKFTIGYVRKIAAYEKAMNSLHSTEKPMNLLKEDNSLIFHTVI